MKKQKATMRLLRTPDLILRVKGRLDARHGQQTCDAFIDGHLHAAEGEICTSLQTLESKLCPLYEESMVLSITLAETDAAEPFERELPADTASVPYLRQMRKIRRLRTEQTARNLSAVERLGRIEETVLSAESDFQEHTAKLERAVSAKIFSYIRGVRANKRAGLADYRTDQVFVLSEAAFVQYREMHRPNTDLRRRILAARLNGKEN